VGFLVTVLLVRYLQAEGFGKYSYAASFVGLFGSLANLGLKKIAVREFVEDEIDDGTVFGTVTVLQVVGGVLAAGIIVPASYLVDIEPVTRGLIFFFTGGLFLKSFVTPDYWFRAEIKSKYPSIVRNVTYLLQRALRVVLILAGASLLAFGGLRVAMTALTIGGFAFIYLRWGPEEFTWNFDWGTGKTFLSDSWPLILSGISVSLYMQIDQVMLGEFRNASEVGIYATAVRLSEIWYFLPMAIGSSVYPAIVESKEKVDEKAYKSRMQAVFDLMAGLSYVLIVPIAFLATPVTVLIFGEEFVRSGQVLQVHIFALLFVSIGVALGQWLLAENFTRFKLVTTGLGAISNLVLNFFLIPEFGAFGAAWATVISYSVSGFWACLLKPESRPIMKQQIKAFLLPFRVKSSLENLSRI
jgi:O-antigen/teichoic acid export membrane protein